MNKKQIKKDANVVVAINSELKTKFQQLCEEEYTTMSSKINQLINEYLKTKQN